MPFSDRSIDVIVATHPDKDHISGLIDVLKHYDVGMYLDPGVSHGTGEYQTLLDTVKKEGLETIHPRRGMNIVLGSSVVARVLFPDRDVSNVETNTGSIVLQVVYGDTEVMLTGDSPQAIEKYLVSLDGTDLESDVLKAGHHGSRTSSSEEFVHAVNPHLAIISAGRNNKYGHPHQEVIDLFKKLGIEIKSTQNLGTITVLSDGEKVWVK